MLEKRRSENHLVNFHYSCALSKKYSQYSFWFGNFGEYNNIKYCKNYIQVYVYRWITNFLLKRFSFFFVIFLYKSSYFLKFVESGFFEYLNYHFLLSFYYNCFTFDLKGKQNIKIFVRSYFRIFFKSRLEKDILILVSKLINEIFLNSLIRPLKDIEIYGALSKLNDKASCSIITDEEKKLFYFTRLINNSYYEFIFTDFNCFYIINSSYCSKNFKVHLKSTKISKLTMEESFISFPRNTLKAFNNDFNYPVKFFEVLNKFIVEEKKIGLCLYQNSNFFFEKSLSGNLLLFKKSFKSCKFLFKTFNICFVKFKYKRFKRVKSYFR